MTFLCRFFLLCISRDCNLVSVLYIQNQGTEFYVILCEINISPTQYRPR